MEAFRYKEIKMCLYNVGHMTRWLRCKKALEIFVFGTSGLTFMNVCMQHGGPYSIIFCPNDLDLI